MNEVLTLDQEARSILREVLNEKDLAIEQLTRQIIQYQTQLTNFEEKFQSLQRTQALTIDQHNIEALMNAGFIKNEDSQFHILIDITQIIHQKLDVVKLDSKIQIIKEVNNANPSVSKQFTDAYELLRNQNNILLKQMSEKDKEYESIINSLKDTIKKSKEEHEKAVAELQSKIEKIQEEKEIIQMETDQIVEEKNGLNHFITELRDKYQQKLKQCQQHISKITELTLKNESLMQQNKELGAQSAILKKSNQQIIEEQKQMKQKYQELEYEYNKFVTSSQDNDSFIKQRQLESINNKKQIKLLQERIKSLDEQCRTLKTQNQRYINQMKKFEGYQVLPSVENIAQSQLKVAASPERQKPKQKRKGKKLIRIGY